MTAVGASTDVVICCYTDLRWDDLCAGVRAVGGQSLRPDRILVVVDHNDSLLRRAELTLPTLSDVAVTVLPNQRRQGLSGARNTAIEYSNAEFIAFLDDDACPDRRWLERLAAPLAQPDVWVTGGRAEPVWPRNRPRWFPPEFDWVVGCSYRGMPTETADVRNVHGASMMYRAEGFARVGGFQEDVGRVGTVPNGCEETELCIRVRRDVAGARVVYTPASVVAHRVSADRVRVRYFLRRCRAEGSSKAAIAQLVGASAATATERSYVTHTLAAAVLTGGRDALRGRLDRLQPVAMVLIGLAVTAFGYAEGKAAALKRSLSGRP